MDYIDVVAHVFYKEARGFYEIEDLWADGIRTDVPNIN
jgi:ribosome-associated protein